MSTRTAMIRARTSPSLKDTVESIFHKLGLSASEAINVFYHQVKLHQGMPFEVKIPNKGTREAMKEVMEGKSLGRAKNVKELFSKLDHSIVSM